MSMEIPAGLSGKGGPSDRAAATPATTGKNLFLFAKGASVITLNF